jgi:large subunit ribosomal protein L19
MQDVIDKINSKYKKKAVVDVRSGDSVKVHQKIREGSKERVQVFEGLVIRTSRKQSHTASITVRRVSGGVGVEKTYLLHSPLVTKVQVVKRSKVRRNYLSYMRQRRGKSARLSGVDFDREAVNTVHDEQAEAEEAKLHEQAAKEAEKKAEQKAKKDAEAEAKAEAALAQHDAVSAQTAAPTPEKAPADRPKPKAGSSGAKK